MMRLCGVTVSVYDLSFFSAVITSCYLDNMINRIGRRSGSTGEHFTKIFRYLYDKLSIEDKRLVAVFAVLHAEVLLVYCTIATRLGD